MKPGSIIHRYIFRELMSPFAVSLAFLMFVFLMTSLIDNITDYVINYRIGFTTVLMMLAYLIPSFLQFIIPMSIMIGVLLAFLKMSSDNEIIALKACGMSIYTMLPPVFAFCLLGCLMTAFMSVYGEPLGRRATESLKRELNTASIAALLEERKFNPSFKNQTLYVTKVNPLQHTLEGIFIEDRSISGRAITIAAPRGRLVADTGSQIFQLHLEQGQINQINFKTETVNATSFDTYQVRLDLSQALESSGGQKDEKEMAIGELREYIRTREKRDEQYYLALITFHNKFSFPFACFSMGILAVPLGVQSKSARRSFGIGLGIFFFLGYYLIMSVGEIYGRTGLYPPIIGMWAPNIIMGGIGLFLLSRCARERTLDLGGMLRLGNRSSRTGPTSHKHPSPPVNS